MKFAHALLLVSLILPASFSWAQESAMDSLREGNLRFMENKPVSEDSPPERREELWRNGQQPDITVLACADSRVAPELIFDQGLGEIFTVRVAGNVADRLVLESIVYSLEHLQVGLVVVLGHSNCGAVQAVTEAWLKSPDGDGSMLFELISPAVAEAATRQANREQLCAAAENANIANVRQTLQKHATIAALLKNGSLTLQGAKYDLASGRVVFLED